MNEVYRRVVNEIVEKHPELRPMYDKAMEDGVLTLKEAAEIVEAEVKLKNSQKEGIQSRPSDSTTGP